MSGWLMFGVVSWFLSLPPPLENGEKKLEIYVRDLDATIIERDALAKKPKRKGPEPMTHNQTERIWIWRIKIR